MLSYVQIVFHHTWYRFALRIPCFSFGILFIIRFCIDPDVDVMYSGFWFIVAINVVALLCLAYTIRYFMCLRKVKDFHETPMNQVLSACDLQFANCHFFYRDHLISFDDPAIIPYKDIVHIETHRRHRKRRYYYSLHLYAKNDKRYSLRTFHRHTFDFYWRQNAEDESNWNEMIQLLKEKSPHATVSPLSPAAYTRKEKHRMRKNKKHS